MHCREGSGSLASNVIESNSHRVEVTTITAPSFVASMHLCADSIVTHCRPVRNGTDGAKDKNTYRKCRHPSEFVTDCLCMKLDLQFNAKAGRDFGYQLLVRFRHATVPPA